MYPRKQVLCLLCITFFILIIISIIFAKLLQLYPLNSYQDCQINPLRIGNPPLFLRPDDSAIVYPSENDSIGFKNGETVHLSCPNGQMNVGGIAVDGVFQATCEYGTLLRIFDEPTDWDQISSCSNSVSSAKYTQKTCDGGEEAVIGFSISSSTSSFISQIYVCFEKFNQTTLYTYYDLVPWKSKFQTKPRFPVEDKGFFNLGSNKLFDLYTKKVQRVTINKLLGLADNDKTYIKDDDSNFLSRGHIGGAADFYYPEEINATYRYLNMAPQWQCINGKNWNQVEIDSRNYAVTKKITLKVWAGTFGIATLPHNSTRENIGLYIYTNGNQRGIPVPAIFWKLLYDPESRKGIVLIVLNNPYIANPSSQTICSDISTKVSWLKWDKNNVKYGYSYACTLDDFRKTVKYAPSLDVSELLL